MNYCALFTCVFRETKNLQRSSGRSHAFLDKGHRNSPALLNHFLDNLAGKILLRSSENLLACPPRIAREGMQPKERPERFEWAGFPLSSIQGTHKATCRRWGKKRLPYASQAIVTGFATSSSHGRTAWFYWPVRPTWDLPEQHRSTARLELAVLLACSHINVITTWSF